MTDTNSTTDDEIARTLNAAADRIQRGWCRGSMNNGFGEACLMGGVSEALGEKPHVDQCYPYIYGSGKTEKWETIFALLGFDKGFLNLTPEQRVARWNDMPWRRKSHVVRRLRKAAKKRERCVERARRRIANIEAGYPAWWPFAASQPEKDEHVG